MKLAIVISPVVLYLLGVLGFMFMQEPKTLLIFLGAAGFCALIVWAIISDDASSRQRHDQAKYPN